MNLDHVKLFDWPPLCRCLVGTSCFANGWLHGDGPTPVAWGGDVEIGEALDGTEIEIWTDCPLFVTEGE